MAGRPAEPVVQGSVYITSQENIPPRIPATTPPRVAFGRSTTAAQPSPALQPQRQISREVFLTAVAATPARQVARSGFYVVPFQSPGRRAPAPPGPPSARVVPLSATAAGAEQSGSFLWVVGTVAYLAFMVLTLVSAILYVVVSADVRSQTQTVGYPEAEISILPTNGSRLATESVQSTSLGLTPMTSASRNAGFTALPTYAGEVLGTTELTDAGYSPDSE
ncbi:hypothetical protein V5799_023276 [Amblyomma americanum]|uniref:Transmembrane protein n=1 Tax=Amblyomma americanum TaxID=6943 RepID=A0AAQ4FJL4_AMBAM